MNRRAFVHTLGGAAAASSVVGLYAGGQRPSAARPERQASPGPGRQLRLEAAPGPVELDLARTAVVVVDMQNDFGSVGGSFQRAGIDISMIQAAVPPTTRVVEAARKASVPVVYLKMGFRPDLSDAGRIDSPNYRRHQDLLGLGRSVLAPSGAASRVLIRDTWNTDIVDALKPQAGDIIIYKHRFSGFFQTDLDAVLQQRGVQSLVVTGCTTSICVESTIRDAMFRDYSCVLLKDCSGEPIGHGLSRSNHDASLLTIEMLLGWVSTSDEFLRGLAHDSRA